MRVRHFTQHGFTLMEVLVTVALIGIIMPSLTVGLLSIVSSIGIQEEMTALSNAAQGKMETVIIKGFVNIPLSNPPGTPEPTLSDQVTIRGQLVSRNVIVDLADGDLPPNGVADADFKQITVEVNSFELHTYISAGL